MAHTAFHPLSNDKGFTLVEMMVALAMALFLIGGTLFVAEYSTQSYRAQERISDAQQNLRSAMDMFVREVRMAGYDPQSSDAGRNPDISIRSATATEVRFTLDRDNSGGIEASQQEDITYRFQGTEIRRITDLDNAVTIDDQPFIDGVNNVTFTYLDADANPTATLSDIAMIDIAMTVQDRDAEGNIVSRTLTTRINCRNLRM